MTTNVPNPSGYRSSNKTFFQGASGIVANNGTFVNNAPENGGTLVQKTDSVVINHLPRKDIHPNFLTAVAPNAFPDAVGELLSGCWPGTRLKVMDDIENWINSIGRSDYQGHIAWLTGPAGCGKSATIQTISERCSDDQIPVASFFFLRDDTTRNHIQPLVASLSYQLSVSPGFPGAEDRANQFITSAVNTHPLIFNQSIQKQFLHLIIPLIRHLQPKKPVVLLIDGLDECASEVHQRYLIRMIHVLVVERKRSTPLKILFASRPEAHLAMPFSQLGRSAGGLLKLSLNDTRYHPEADIRLFVLASFDDIRGTHRLRANLGSVWPSNDAIEHIVSKSSGQFLYAAAVMQFVAKASTNPADRLAAVIGARPSYSFQPLQTDSAFARMDMIFNHVLSACAESDRETLKSILAGQIILHSIGDETYNLDDCLAPLDIDAAVIDHVISGLPSMVQYDGDKLKILSFYHASLPDFLVDKARAQKHHIDINSFAAKLVGKILQETDITERSSTFKFMSSILRHVLEPNSDLTSTLLCCPNISYQLYDDNDPDLHESFFIILQSIRALYFPREKDVYESLLQTWLGWGLPQLYNHLNVVPWGMRRYDMIQESRQKRLTRDAVRLFSDFFWSGDYDRESAEASRNAYLDSKDVATLESAIKNYKLTIDQYRKHKNASLAKTLFRYASVVWYYYEDVSRSPDDLDKAICLYTEAQGADSWSGNTETYLKLLNHLGRAYFEQYKRAFGPSPIKPEGKQKAFEKAVGYYTELQDNPDAGECRRDAQIQLGVMACLKCKHERTLDCFEIGVQYLQDALLETMKAGEEIDAGNEGDEVKQGKKAALDGIQVKCLLHLGALHYYRYELTEGPTKIPRLTMAIEYLTKATPFVGTLKYTHLPACLHNLSRYLCLRWQHTKVLSDYILAKEMSDAFRDCVGDDAVLMRKADDLKNTLLKAAPEFIRTHRLLGHVYGALSSGRRTFW
ncbi:hypothetical protein D9619_008225 [Psilocybe cf. subviscida]|uniref:Nephrocystin 3-like N-terminal domain-containing protein n=1 Tax=Psilocybe cf. subviscida TaxID=2480587 RepID=A0A8H5ATD9_9AGAR|nr:hypothetical protein D9619_008225 [Psilocybe cf. subviscida]